MSGHVIGDARKAQAAPAPAHAPDADRLAALLAEHEYVVDGPPAACGFRCTCGAREATTSPESADLAARLHVAAVLTEAGVTFK